MRVYQRHPLLCLLAAFGLCWWFAGLLVAIIFVIAALVIDSLLVSQELLDRTDRHTKEIKEWKGRHQAVVELSLDLRGRNDELAAANQQLQAANAAQLEEIERLRAAARPSEDKSRSLADRVWDSLNKPEPDKYSN